MGSVLSAENVSEVTENELLKKFTGKEPMNSNDPQWNKMFSFNFLIDQRSRKAQNEFLVCVKPLLEELLHNSRETANFSTIVRVVGRRCSELEASVKCANKIFIWQTSNALLFMRYVAIFLAQRLSPGEFARFFVPNDQTIETQKEQLNADESLAQQLERVTSRNGPGGTVSEKEPEQFLTHLVKIITQIPVSELTLQLHAEAIRLLLALLSTQLYEETITEHSEFLKLLMTQLCTQSGDIVRVLLENFLYHFDEELDDAKMGGGGVARRQSRSDSFVISLWSTLQRTLAIGSETDEHSDGLASFPPQNLSTLSLALLLSLVYYPSFEGRTNAYKQMLSIFQNAQEVSSLDHLEASFKLDFTHLYNRLCSTLHAERMPLLLLYLLLHNNIGFRNFVLSRINLEQLVLPVIRVLYDGMCFDPGHGLQRSSSISSSKARQRDSQFGYNNSMVHTHQTYLALIVLLMLSEDDFFKKVIHEMTIKNIDWFATDRPTQLTETTLGALIVLVFSKTIQINTVRVRDRYFHMNSLATLANLASCFKQLSPLASQKLIGLLETMTKRRAKLIRLLRERAENNDQPQQQISKETEEGAGGIGEDNPVQGGGQDEAAAKRTTGTESGDDLHHDITALEEGIRTMLEIVNACLCQNLRNNPNLIYTILYKRAIFEHFHQHPMFQDLVWNIYTVINHFTAKVETLTKGGMTGSAQGQEVTMGVNNASVSDILEAIKKGAIEWPSDRLKKFPDLRFKYIEDEDTVDFFVPYIWRLANDGLCLQFDADAIRLFSVEGEQ